MTAALATAGRTVLPYGIEDRRQQRRVRAMRALFVVGLVVWTSIAVWWAVYFHRATVAVRDAQLQSLSATQLLYARDFHRAPDLVDFSRTLPASLEVATLPIGPEAALFPHVLVPVGQGQASHAIVLSAAERHRLEHEVQRKTVMLAGEGSLLITLLFVVHFALYRMLEGAWRLNRQRDSFVHAVTHEFKSPLAGLRALLQSLEMLELGPEERRQVMQMGLGEIARLDRMVGNILLSTQLDAHALKSDVTTVDLAEILHALAGRKRLLFAERGGSLTLDLGPAAARFDAEALDAILENLIENALKYSPNAPVVRISTRPDGASIALTVEDEGVGIAASDLPHLFEKFYRAPAGEQVSAKGTGLGLFIARGLARASGGDLVAASDGPGRGARFTLRLPT